MKVQFCVVSRARLLLQYWSNKAQRPFFFLPEVSSSYSFTQQIQEEKQIKPTLLILKRFTVVSGVHKDFSQVDKVVKYL